MRKKVNHDTEAHKTGRRYADMLHARMVHNLGEPNGKDQQEWLAALIGRLVYRVNRLEQSVAAMKGARKRKEVVYVHAGRNQ